VAAQSGYVITGYVYDSLTREPLPDAEVLISGYTGKTLSDRNGHFSFPCSTIDYEAEISRISYYAQHVVLHAGLPDTVFLKDRSYELSPIQIVADVPRDLMPGMVYHILDYEFSGENIILLAFERKSIFLPKLLLINSKGDTLNAVDVRNPLKLCSDYDGKTYFMSRTTSFEINTDSDRIILCNPVSNENFCNITNTITGHKGDIYFLRQYLCNNQVLNYYSYDELRDKLSCFRTITDIENIQRNRWGAYFDGREEDIRFQQLIMNPAVNAPLIILYDTVYLFNFLTSKLEKYNLACDTFAFTDIDFHHDKGFSDDLIIDQIKSKVYALSRKNGISKIKEINAFDGKVLQTIDIPDFVFIEKINIHDGIIYFLFKTRDLSEYKKLYSMKI